MKAILLGIVLCFILVFWYLANVMNKPILNRMSNYYEADEQGKNIANFLIALSIVLSIFFGTQI